MRKSFVAHRAGAPCVAALCAVILVFAAGQAHAQFPFASLKDGQAIPAPALAQLKTVSRRDAGRAPVPRADPLQAVPDAKPGAGKPWVLYVGGEFCPYCAALRWPLVLALMRFGNFTGLKATRSSSSDVYPNTATFSFVGSTYRSRWLDLQAVETADRQDHPLQKPDKFQMAQFLRFDRAPYTNEPGSIPFLDLDGRWVAVGSPFDPELLHGMGWYDVAARLESGKGPLWEAVLGEADLLTRQLCVLTRGQPRATCDLSTRKR
ncbi:MAG: DUF929 family protein [Rhodanobacteraceae bacterium]